MANLSPKHREPRPQGRVLTAKGYGGIGLKAVTGDQQSLL